MANKKITRTIYWKWDYETGQTQADKDRNDEADSYWINKNSIEIPITVTGEQVNQNPSENKYEITYDANGGIIKGYGNSGKMSKLVTCDETYGELPEVSSNGYTFVGWTTDNLLDYNNLMRGATNRDIYVDKDGYVIDSTPEDDARSWRYDMSNWYTVVEKGTYVLTLEFSKLSTNQYAAVAIFDENHEFFSANLMNVSIKTLTIQIPETTQIGIEAKGFDGIYRIKLEKGSSATEWTPYKSITSASQVSKTNGSTVVAQWKKSDYDGKNILNYNNLLSGAINRGILVDKDGYISDDTPLEDGRTWTPEYANWKVTLEPGFYTLSLEFSKMSTSPAAQMGVFSANTQILDVGLRSTNKKIFTIQIAEECEIAILAKGFDGVYRIKLERGTVCTDWEPY